MTHVPVRRVTVTFDYYPEDPDDEDPSGMAEDEYTDLMDKITSIGGDNPTVSRSATA